MRVGVVLFFFFYGGEWGTIDEESLSKYSTVGQYRGVNFKG